MRLSDRTTPHPISREDRLRVVYALLTSPLDMEMPEAIDVLGLNQVEYDQLLEDIDGFVRRYRRRVLV